MITRDNVAYLLPQLCADPGISDWLKAAIQALEQRDANDAADDAALLSAIFTARLNALYGRDLQSA